MFLLHTFTLEALSQQTPQQRPTVVAEGQNFKAVDAEHVWHVDAEPLRSDRLEDTQHNTTRQDTESCIQQTPEVFVSNKKHPVLPQPCPPASSSPHTW